MIIGLLLGYLAAIAVVVRLLGGERVYASPFKLWQPRAPEREE